MEYPRSFVLGGKKNLQGRKGKGIRGGGGGGGGGGKERKNNNWGKTEGEMERGKKKKETWENRTVVARIDLAQESNALPVTLQLHCGQF